MKCAAVIDLIRPVRSERVRGFQPPWRTVYVYTCPGCGATHRVRAASFLGRNPVPSRGGIRCDAFIPGSDNVTYTARDAGLEG
jgi:hypothetical protein